MTPQTAKTLSAEVNSDLMDLFKSTNEHLSLDDSRLLEFIARADDLGKHDGAERSLILARVYALTGDVENVNYYLRNAKQLHASADGFDLTQITVLLSLGYYIEALSVIRRCGDPERNLLNTFLNQPPTIGAFQLMRDFYSKAKAMNLTNVPALDKELEEAARIMDSWGDSDDDYATALEFAGTVMRKHKLFHSRDGYILRTVIGSAGDSDTFVKMAYPVNVDLDTAIEMTCEFSDLLAHSDAKIPQSLVFEFVPLKTMPEDL